MSAAVDAPALREEFALLLSGDPEAVQDPYPLYARLRDEAPVFAFDETTVIVTRHELAKTVYRENARFPNPGSRGAMFGAARRRLLSPEEEKLYDQVIEFESRYLSRMNGETHRRARSAGQRAFTPKRIAELRETTAHLIEDLLDELAAQETPDLMRFATRLPLLVIMEMMDAPYEDAEMLKAWGDAVNAPAGQMPARPEAVRAAHEGALQYREYVRALADRHRSSSDTTTLIGALLDASAADQLDPEELVAMYVLLLFAGHETTTNMFGNGMHALLRHRDQWERLCTDPALAATTVEEVLRFDSPVQFFAKSTTEEQELGGVTIPGGTFVLAGNGAANRDPLADARAGHLDLVYTQRLDRLSRGGARSLLEIVGGLRDHGVRLVSLSESLDLGGPVGAIVLAVLGAVAQMERQLMSERVAATNEAGVRRRRTHGGQVPYGYRRAGRGEVVVEAAEADVVRRVFRWYADGRTQRDIEAQLNADGIPAKRGGRWASGSISSLLANDAYVGVLRFKGEDVGEAAWEPIVDAALWDRVRAMVAGRRVAPTGPQGRRPRSPYLLRGLALCGVCGGRLWCRTENGHQRLYVCSNRRHGCPQRPLDAALVDTAVLEHLLADVADAELTADGIRDRVAAAAIDADALGREAAQRRRKAGAALRRAREAFYAGSLSAESYEEMRGELEARVAEAQAGVDRFAVAAADARAEATHLDTDGAARRIAADLRRSVAACLSDGDLDNVEAVRGMLAAMFESFVVDSAPADYPGELHQPQVPPGLRRRAPVRPGYGAARPTRRRRGAADVRARRLRRLRRGSRPPGRAPARRQRCEPLAEPTYALALRSPGWRARSLSACCSTGSTTCASRRGGTISTTSTTSRSASRPRSTSCSAPADRAGGRGRPRSRQDRLATVREDRLPVHERALAGDEEQVRVRDLERVGAAHERFLLLRSELRLALDARALVLGRVGRDLGGHRAGRDCVDADLRRDIGGHCSHERDDGTLGGAVDR